MKDSSTPPKARKPRSPRSGGPKGRVHAAMKHFLDFPTSPYHLENLVSALIDYEIHARLKLIASEDKDKLPADFPYPPEGCVVDSVLPRSSDQL